MGKFNGKVFLELGTSIASVDIVEYAKSEGAYVIVADYLPTEKSEAKKFADETAMISTLDVDAIVRFAQKKKIDGVFCGVSELNLQSVQKVCSKLNLPCYFDLKLWKTIQNKQQFKIACVSSHVPVPKSYDRLDEVVFPVIVKPADGSGSRGIVICRNQEQLEKACMVAKTFSKDDKILIEEYIEADDVMVFFNVHNGIVDLSATCDRLMFKFSPESLQIPAGYMYPSKHIYSIDKGLKNLTNLIKQQGIQNGLIGFQCFVEGDDLLPFDPTFRLDGTTSYNITEAENNTNVMKMLVDYSLLGTMGNDEIISSQENPFFIRRYFQLPIILGRGKIEKIIGLEGLTNNPGVIKVYQLKKEGDLLEYDSHFTQIGARIHLIANSCNELKRLIRSFLSSIRFEDKEGNNLVLNQYYDYGKHIDEWFE